MGRTTTEAVLGGVGICLLLAQPLVAEPGRPDHAWQNRDLSPDVRAEMVVRQMTADEKFAWISQLLPVPGAPQAISVPGAAAHYQAIPRLGIPARTETDAGLGVTNRGDVRPGDRTTALPSTLLLGATFDPTLAHQAGAVIGREARARGFNVQLAGGANLIREPRGGRSFEYVSEDPLVTGLIAGQMVAGIQSEGVVSTVKHFAVNAQENGRVMASSDMSEAALRESDLLAFQIAIETGQPGSVMTGYNLLNGVYTSESDFLIDRVLKRDWGYAGWVMSDWGGTHSTERAALAGLDVQSGGMLDAAPFFGRPLQEAVAADRVPQARIDDMVRRILRSMFAVGAIDAGEAPQKAEVDAEAHRLVARKVAENGIVLLKNSDDMLPLKPGAGRILIIGAHADIGVLSGGGSSSVTPPGSLKMTGTSRVGFDIEKAYHPSSPLAAIQSESAGIVTYLDGTDLAAAAAGARDAEAVIVFAEEWRTEVLDATGLALPDHQDALIEAVAAANPRTIVVLETGGPVTMPWLARVPAVLAAWYPGIAGGEAIAGVLFGRVNPSGRLPITFPSDEGDLPRPIQSDPTMLAASPGLEIKGGIVNIPYDIEGSDVGYRWASREGKMPLFRFGHGLSYTRFALSELAIERQAMDLLASLTVTNEGSRPGIDTPQVYVSLPGPEGFAPRLAAFSRVALEPGESRRVSMRIDRRLLARYDTERGGFRVAGGSYLFGAGEDSGPGILRERVTLEAIDLGR
ncbi:beta-glucosidase [Microvirga antarctica]|uniref:beta-glucosidase n=1 Tax=Microvirga antarctica TaxID=2819233 RepID=UPI001B305E61|nr:glycoside hydrolase family 3 C-terminal domain-containing protein [Microvirga antarctica]